MDCIPDPHHFTIMTWFSHIFFIFGSIFTGLLWFHICFCKKCKKMRDFLFRIKGRLYWNLSLLCSGCPICIPILTSYTYYIYLLLLYLTCLCIMSIYDCLFYTCMLTSLYRMRLTHIMWLSCDPCFYLRWELQYMFC